mmetsp:Transcript_13151/g.27502  ORF Transcript_13151/g.27502 Transcript_13151/m.27502 type:complete len:82 (-) Transcript_13151:139-384(-)
MAISTNVYATVFAVPPVRTLVFTARLTYIMMSTSPAPTVAGFSLGPFHFPVADQAEWAERLGSHLFDDLRRSEWKSFEDVA